MSSGGHPRWHKTFSLVAVLMLGTIVKLLYNSRLLFTEVHETTGSNSAVCFLPLGPCHRLSRKMYGSKQHHVWLEDTGPVAEKLRIDRSDVSFFSRFQSSLYL